MNSSGFPDESSSPYTNLLIYSHNLHSFIMWSLDVTILVIQGDNFVLYWGKMDRSSNFIDFKE